MRGDTKVFLWTDFFLRHTWNCCYRLYSVKHVYTTFPMTVARQPVVLYVHWSEIRTVDRAHSDQSLCTDGGQHNTAALTWSTTSCSPVINQRNVLVWRKHRLSPETSFYFFNLNIRPCPLLQPAQVAAAAAALHVLHISNSCKCC